jgi:hypothetical protein
MEICGALFLVISTGTNRERKRGSGREISVLKK